MIGAINLDEFTSMTTHLTRSLLTLLLLGATTGSVLAGPVPAAPGPAAGAAKPTENPYLQYVPVPATPQPAPPAANQAMPNGRAAMPPTNPPPAANGAKPAAAAPAAEVQAPDISGLLRAFGQYFTEEETDLLLDYLRDSAMASLNGGEEASLPPELAFKLAILQQRMKKEGAFYFQVLIQQLERDLDRAMKEYRNPPPPPPYELPQQRGQAR